MSDYQSRGGFLCRAVVVFAVVSAFPLTAYFFDGVHVGGVVSTAHAAVLPSLRYKYWKCACPADLQALGTCVVSAPQMTCDGGVCTGKEPDGGLDGLNLDDVEGFTLFIFPQSGYSFDAGGTMRARVYSKSQVAWAKAQDLDQPMSEGTNAATPGMEFPDFDETYFAGRRVKFIPDGIIQIANDGGTNGATCMDIILEAALRR